MFRYDLADILRTPLELRHDLHRRALTLPDRPAVPRAYAAAFSWHTCTLQFLDSLLAAPLPVRHEIKLVEKRAA